MLSKLSIGILALASLFGLSEPASEHGVCLFKTQSNDGEAIWVRVEGPRAARKPRAPRTQSLGEEEVAAQAAAAQATINAAVPEQMTQSANARPVKQ